MLSEVLPCFQLLRIGLDPSPGSHSPVSQDLYTFRPATPRCTFRLGRREEVCDVTLVSEKNPELISRVHAEIHAEREADVPAGEWRVYLVDCSSHGTFVNDVRVPRGQRVELCDGDMVTFGHEDADRLPEGALALQQESEFYFMFQKVRVRPQDFDAITAPKVQNVCGFQPVKFREKGVNAAKFPASSGATLILNSIGSISKFKPQPLTFSRSKGGSPGVAGKQAQASLPPPSRTADEEAAAQAATPGTPARSFSLKDKPPAARNRRKSAHTVLPELEDEMPHGAEQSPPPLKRPKTEREAEPAHYTSVWPVLRRRTSEDDASQRRPKEEPTRRDGDGAQALNDTPPNRKRRGRPRKHPPWSSCQVLTQTLYAVEQCAAERCHLPQDDTVQWVQCDDCDAWYHLACVGCNYNAVKDADFHCGCT